MGVTKERWRDVVAVAMAVVWLWGGVLHFTWHREVMNQMPSYWPWKSFFVYASGVIELVIGAALVPRPSRRYGAIGTMLLLVLFIPAVYQIVVENTAMLGRPEVNRAVFRWSVIPGNLALFAGASWLRRSTVTPSA